MSIYTKPIDQMTWQDVEAFCTAPVKPREGLRLDFKESIPKDLAKVLAAFGNTAGGIIILGIKGDASNEPIWPPSGFTVDPHVSETIHQVAYDAVQPPVAVEVSPLIKFPTDPNRAIVVIRIAESADAPHAVDGGRKIYERSGDVTKPIEFANIDRIARLLRRRGSIEGDRERLIQGAKDRALRLTPVKNLRGGYRWASAIPLFPTTPICTIDDCHLDHSQTEGDPLYGPGGVYSIGHEKLAGQTYATKYAATSVHGHVFAWQHCTEMHQPLQIPGEPPGQRYLLLSNTERLAFRTFDRARRLFREHEFFDGLVQLSYGFEQCFGLRMFSGFQGDSRSPGPPFPDETYRSDIVVHAHQLIKGEVVKAWAPIFRDIQLSFGLPVSRAM